MIHISFEKGSNMVSNVVNILINDDSEDEFTECFTVKSFIMEDDCATISTICIRDVRKVLYSFKEPQYEFYESTNATLMLKSSRAIPTDLAVDVDTIVGSENASGERQQIYYTKMHNIILLYKTITVVYMQIQPICLCALRYATACLKLLLC